MRIQIAPLPPITVGDSTSIPFLLVIDRASEAERDSLTPEFSAELRQSTGAACVLLAGTHEVEVGQPLTLTPEHMLHLEAQIAAQLGTVSS